jgi:hypothetical protein
MLRRSDELLAAPSVVRSKTLGLTEDESLCKRGKLSGYDLCTIEQPAANLR